MRKSYQSPQMVELGSIAELTAAYGSDPDPDVSEFPDIPADHGSFDVCEELVCEED